MRYLLWSKVDRAWVRLAHEDERSDHEWETTDDIDAATLFHPIDLVLQLSIANHPDDLHPIPHPEDVREQLDHHILECQDFLTIVAVMLGVDITEDGYDTLDHTRLIAALHVAMDEKAKP